MDRPGQCHTQSTGARGYRMKIRSLFITSMAVYAAILIIIGALVIANTSEAVQLNQLRDTATLVATESYELNQIAHDYHLHGDDQYLAQWFAKNSAVLSHLSQITPATPEEQALITGIRENLRIQEEIFREISASGTAGTPFGMHQTSDAYLALWSRMSAANQRITTDASHLADLIKDDLDRARYERLLMVYSFLGITMIIFLVNFYLVDRRIMHSVSVLQEGMKNAGSGNLGFRLEENGGDEFQNLAASFNDMAAHRQAAENELLRNHDQLNAAYGRLAEQEEELRENYDRLVSGERALAESEEKLRLIYDNTIDAILLTVPDGGILSANAAACGMFQRTEEELVRLRRVDVVDTSDPHIIEAVRIREETGQFKGELRLKRRDGSVFPAEVSSSIFTDRNGQRMASMIIHDITNRKMMEEEIRSLNSVLEERVRDRTELLNKSLQEKEVLLKEIHHRVKNNLQIIASLFSIQSRYIKDDAVLNVLRESQNRVKAMALVHERLYRSEDIAHIDLTEYMTFLVSSLFQFYNVSTARVRFTVDMKQVPVDIHTAIPIGLIVNELVSNSMKYAFPGDARGEIAITGTKEGNRIDLVVKDTGIGIPEDFNWHNAQSLGLRLVIMLTDQMNGTIERMPGPGTAFHITLFEKC